MNVSIHKLVSIITDGAPAMTGENVGFIGLCKKDPAFPIFFSYHCVIHQQALCTKVIDFQHVMSVVQKIVNSILARPLPHRLFKHLLDETDAHYGDLILHTEVRWLSRGKVLFRFQKLITAIMLFLQDRGDLPPQLKDSRLLLAIAFYIGLTAKLNELNTEFQGKNKTIIKMIGTADSFTGKLQLWNIQLMKGVLTHFPSVQICADGAFDASVYNLCIDELLRGFERRFKDSERMNFTVSFITNPFQEGDISESAELISSVLKENVSELELEIINMQTDLSLKIKVNDTNFWNLVLSNIVSYSQTSVIKGECMFRFYLFKRIGVFNNENAIINAQIVIN
jgi:hypothetical protein